MRIGSNREAPYRDNNFNLLRIIAASAVLGSHAYPIALGPGAEEPLTSLVQMSLGTLAVLTFFAISGFFIAQSFDRSPHIIDYCVARFLRIYPALIVALILTTFVLGPIFTTDSVLTYLSRPTTLLYLPSNLSLKWLQYELPGVFHANPFGPAVNGSLWTLFYEAVCYCMVALLGMISFTRQLKGFVVFLAAYVTCYLSLKLIGENLLNHATVVNLQELTLPFLLGMALYRLRNFVRLSLIGCFFGLIPIFFAQKTFWFHEVFVLSWCYWVFYIGFLSNSFLKIYNRLGDYSYGMYIYAFPCEQACAALWPGIAPIKIMAISFPITLVLAALSWHFIEHWSLAHRGPTTDWLKRRLLWRPTQPSPVVPESLGGQRQPEALS